MTPAAPWFQRTLDYFSAATNPRRRGTVVALLIVLAAAVAAYNYLGISSAFARSQQFYVARQITWQVLESLFREESALRGYTSTKDAQYLPSFTTAHHQYDRQFARLQRYMWAVDVPGSGQYLNDIKRIHAQWMTTVASKLIANPTGAAAQDRQRTGELLLTTLGDDVTSLNNILDTKVAASVHDARVRILTAIIEIALLTVLFGLTIMSIRRSSRRVEQYFMAEITEANKTLVSAQRLAGVGNWAKDLKSGRTTWSAELYRIFDVPLSAAPEDDIRRFDHAEDAPKLREAVGVFEQTGQPYRIDHRIVTATGDVRHVQEQAEFSTDADGNPTRIIGTIVDVTERKLAEARLAYLAHHDALTGLPNRTMLNERLEHSMAYAQRHGGFVAVLFLDLDRFKNVNDTRGHTYGDQLLRKVAERLRGVVRATDTVARSGGDEFIIVAGDVANPGDLLAIASNVHNAFAKPFELEGEEVFCTSSVGVSVFPQDGSDVDTLIKNADAALYLAKGNGRNNIQYFTVDIVESASRRMALEADMRRGLERGEFRLHYQPLVGLRSGKLLGFEALLRWHHPELGLVLPEEFIPVAEESGIIVQLGEWVLQTACAQQKSWVDQGYDVQRVTVNISARQIQTRQLETIIGRVIAETGITPSALEIELTETLLMSDIPGSVLTLRNLREMGVSISIDDFGTGYSSLGYLKNFPIDSLKIDRTFVRDITTDRYDEAIAAAIVALARSLGMHVIAEGVETPAQLAQLLRLGCDEGQGYHFGQPLPPEACIELLEAHTMRENHEEPA
ncbi:MAG TPA: EAL domain-containing protein [Candidatus Eremiobacteraceae bacterium]